MALNRIPLKPFEMQTANPVPGPRRRVYFNHTRAISNVSNLEVGHTSDISLISVNGEEFSPKDFANLEFWVRADLGIIERVSGANILVASWLDQSPYTRHTRQTVSGAYQPLFIENASGLNDQPVIRFDGTNDYLLTETFTVSQPFTFWIVGDWTNQASGTVTFGDISGGSGCSYLYRNTSGVLMTLQSPLNVSGGSFTNWLGGHNVIATISSGATVLYRDGAPDLVTGNVGTAGLNGLTLGTNAALALFADVDIAELGIISGILSNAQINQLGNYLADRYGSTWNTVT